MASDPFGIDLSLELLSKLPEEPQRLTDDQSSSHLVIESSMNWRPMTTEGSTFGKNLAQCFERQDPHSPKGNHSLADFMGSCLVTFSTFLYTCQAFKLSRQILKSKHILSEMWTLYQLSDLSDFQVKALSSAHQRGWSGEPVMIIAVIVVTSWCFCRNFSRRAFRSTPTGEKNKRLTDFADVFSITRSHGHF